MLKKLLAAMLAVSLIAAMMTGCDKRKEEEVSVESEVSQSESEDWEDNSESEESKSMTTEEIAENNSAIKDSDINLVQLEEAKAEESIAVMVTTKGTVKIRLFPDQAPKAVENFIALSEEGYYNGVEFHRVVPNFVIQGGDPTGTGAGGESSFSKSEGDPGYFEDEFSLDLWHFRGALSMANAGAGTNTSQFFIVQKDSVDEKTLGQMREGGYPEKVTKQYEELGGTPNLDHRHTVFGMVTEGMDVVDEISKVATEKEKPVEPVLIESITIEKK